MQKKEIDQLKKEIENILNDNKALEIKSINLKDKTSIAANNLSKKDLIYMKSKKINISSSLIRKFW